MIPPSPQPERPRWPAVHTHVLARIDRCSAWLDGARLSAIAAEERDRATRARKRWRRPGAADRPEQAKASGRSKVPGSRTPPAAARCLRAHQPQPDYRCVEPAQEWLTGTRPSGSAMVRACQRSLRQPASRPRPVPTTGMSFEKRRCLSSRVRLTSGISRGALDRTAPSAACRVSQHPFYRPERLTPCRAIRLAFSGGLTSIFPRAFPTPFGGTRTSSLSDSSSNSSLS